jgi:arylformamidase
VRIIDISRPLSSLTAPWPGDTPFSLTWTARIARGSTVNLSAISTSPHVGTHADAPLHVRDGADGIDSADLSAYIGPARVVAVAADRDGLVPLSALDGLTIAEAPRILFKTGTDPDSLRWPERFAALSPDIARELSGSGARLVGIDTPSVDDAKSETLPVHTILLDGGVVWLENLDLSRVEAGVYELVALPLRIVGACASPVRAVLLAP